MNAKCSVYIVDDFVDDIAMNEKIGKMEYTKRFFLYSCAVAPITQHIREFNDNNAVSCTRFLSDFYTASTYFIATLILTRPHNATTGCGERG